MAKQNLKKPSSSNADQKSIELTEIEQELTTINPEVFQGVNQKKKEEILRSISITMIQERTHSGPLPDPESLVKYNSVITEGADRIMKMAEKQQEHRMTLETKIIANQTKQSVLGQWFGLIIGIVGIGCGTFLAYSGESTVGGIIAGATVVSLVLYLLLVRNIKNLQIDSIDIFLIKNALLFTKKQQGKYLFPIFFKSQQF